MLFTSPVYSAASGSVAGLTYSHNRGGMYARSRVTPTDPSTSDQQAARTRFSGASQFWSNALSAAQRAGWENYAANVPMTNRLGETIYLTGQQHYIRANSVRPLAGAGFILPAPTINNLGTFTSPTVGEVNDNDEIDVNFTNTDDWAATDGGFLLAWSSRALDPTINFFRGPYQFLGFVTGNTAIPPTSPEEMSSPFALALAQRIWIRIRILQVDGRLSESVILGPTAVTAGA